MSDRVRIVCCAWLLVAAGCGGGTGGQDGPDLALPSPDLAGAPDLAGDLARSDDLTPPPDLLAAADLTAAPDLTTAPDLSCPSGTKSCGAGCIANTACCTNADCSPNHATPTCSSGVCTSPCEPGFADCDNDLRTTGCEIDIQNDIDHCGACDLPCSGNHIGSRTCTSGQCTGACDPNFADCDGNKQTNGCESDLRSDPANCGACQKACSTNHISSPACASGQCTGACDSGFLDCNGDRRSDGCEVDTQTDPANCGGCNSACSPNHIATNSCTSGSCTGTCAGGFADCNGDKRTDGCEIDTQTDPDHCGGCSTVCSASNVAVRSCGAGQCTSTCAHGWDSCDNDKQSNGCEFPVVSDAANCGGCGIQCTGAASVCFDTACACPQGPGYLACANGCTDVRTDAANCGACGNACAAGTTCDGTGHCTAPCTIAQADPGDGFTCYRTGDGAVWCWGANAYSQLGNNDTTDSATPVPLIGPSDVVQVATATYHSCARQRDGQVWCWSKPPETGIAAPTLRVPYTLPLPLPAIDLSVSFRHSCAVLQDHSVWCWGYNDNGQNGHAYDASHYYGVLDVDATPVPVAGLTGVVQTIATRFSTCALRLDGTVWCWGNNWGGLLGRGPIDYNSDYTSSPNYAPQPVPGLSGIVELAAGDTHACARNGYGEVWCWGANNAGQLATGDQYYPSGSPLKTLFSGAVSLEAGVNATCILRSDHSLWCAGIDVGDASPSAHLTPVQVAGSFDDVELNVYGNTARCVRRTSGVTQCWTGGDVPRDLPVPAGATFAACGGRCADTQSDAANCGGCGQPCGDGQLCSGGSCVSSGLVAHWTMEDGSGALVSDSSGSGHPATLVGSPTWTTGYSGGGLQFDGTSQYLTADTGYFTTDAPFTISGWVNTTPTSDGPIFAFASAADASGGITPLVDLSFPSGGRVIWLRTGNYGFGLSAPDGAWHFVSVTYVPGGSQNLVFSVDDQQITRDYTYTPVGPQVFLTNHGQRSYDFHSFFGGSMDDVRIYTRALTPLELRRLYLGQSL